MDYNTNSEGIFTEPCSTFGFFIATKDGVYFFIGPDGQLIWAQSRQSGRKFLSARFINGNWLVVAESNEYNDQIFYKFYEYSDSSIVDFSEKSINLRQLFRIALIEGVCITFSSLNDNTLVHTIHAYAAGRHHMMDMKFDTTRQLFNYKFSPFTYRYSSNVLHRSRAFGQPCLRPFVVRNDDGAITKVFFITRTTLHCFRYDQTSENRPRFNRVSLSELARTIDRCLLVPPLIEGNKMFLVEKDKYEVLHLVTVNLKKGVIHRQSLLNKFIRGATLCRNASGRLCQSFLEASGTNSILLRMEVLNLPDAFHGSTISHGSDERDTSEEIYLFIQNILIPSMIEYSYYVTYNIYTNISSNIV